MILLFWTQELQLQSPMPKMWLFVKLGTYYNTHLMYSSKLNSRSVFLGGHQQNFFYKERFVFYGRTIYTDFSDFRIKDWKWNWCSFSIIVGFQ